MKNKLFLIFICLILLSVSSVSAGDINQTNIDDVDNSVLSISNDVIVDTISASENDNLSSNGEYVDVNEAYDSLNAFRTEDNVWQWNDDDATKTYFNTNDDNKLEPLAWDTALEETAKIRAKELSQSFSHTRPDGTICFTAFPDNLWAMGENIAMGTSLTGNGATELWKETDYMYDGQGHRRNMLSSDFNCVGIAGFEKDGNVYWVQDFGYNSNIVYDENVRPTPIETSETNNGLYVNSSVKANGDGSKSNPFKDLKSALDKSKNGDTVYIAPGTYTGVNNTDLTISKSLNITNWTKGEVIFDGENNHGIFVISVVTNINGLTLINGKSSSGGAIYSKGSANVTVSNCSFVNNSAPEFDSAGGAIFTYGDMAVSNCSFVNNSAIGDGGAIYSRSANVTVSNCSFLNNSAIGDGGAIYSSIAISRGGGNVTVSNCTFINNTANTYGGGAICSYSDMTVSNCNFVNNSARYAGGGGAIRTRIANVTVSNCSFLNNSAHWDGGAIFTSDNISILNSSFKNNKDLNNYAIVIYEYSNVNLNSNIIDNLIYNNGTIISPTTIVVLDNKTINTSKKDFILNATIYDDNGNIIVCDDFNFTINNKSIKGTLENDTFKANVNLDADMNIINATSVYGLLTNNTVKIGIINIDTNTQISAPDVIKYFRGSERFIVTITNNNLPVANTTVKITINGVPYTRTTNASGKASIPLGLASGTYQVTTEYGNQKVNSKVTIKPTITANDVSKIFRNGTQYYATFTDSQGNLLKNTDVTFNINGVFYTRKTNENGIAKLNINLNPGKYILTANNPVTDEQKSNNIEVLPSIIENNDITKYYRNGTQYVVRILNIDGTIAGAGINVTFNINGVFYTRITNASGYAKLNINLAPDEYTITAEYNTLRVSNKIKVLPVLSAEDLSMSFKDGSKFEAKLVDGQGNAYASQTIKFNINGVFYDRTTDANGIAKLNINLMSGKYIITSMYNGAAISNEVTIS